MEQFHLIWPTWSELAGDLDAPYPTVNAWARRGIPHKRFRQIIDAAQGRGVEISHDWLEAINDLIAARAAKDAAA